MPLTTVSRSGSSVASMGSCDSLFFDDSLTNIDYVGGGNHPSPLDAPPDQAEQVGDGGGGGSEEIASARLQEAQYTIATLRSTVDHLQSALEEAHASADDVENENAKLRQQVKAMAKERDEMLKLVSKVKKVATFLKKDVRQSDAECVELRLEIEALKRERDEYKAKAGIEVEARTMSPTSTAASAAASNGADNGSAASRSAATPSADADSRLAAKNESKNAGNYSPSSGGDVATDMPSPSAAGGKGSRAAARTRRGSVGSRSVRTSRTADTSCKSIYSRGSHDSVGSVVVEDDDEEDVDEMGESSRPIPAFAPLNTVAVKRRRKKKAGAENTKGGKKDEDKKESEDTATSPPKLADLSLVEERSRSA